MNAFPFANEGPGLRESLEHVGDLVDQGYSIIIAPEGAIPADGRMLPFKSGIGLLAVELGIDVIGVKIQPDYQRVFPDFSDNVRDLFPRGRRRIEVRITRPMRFARDVDHREAARRLEQALRDV